MNKIKEIRSEKARMKKKHKGTHRFVGSQAAREGVAPRQMHYNGDETSRRDERVYSYKV